MICPPHQNRIKAMTILRSRLYEQTRQIEQAKRNKLRSDQVSRKKTNSRSTLRDIRDRADGALTALTRRSFSRVSPGVYMLL